MVENSVISIFEGVYSLVLMKRVRKTQKNEQVLEKFFFHGHFNDLHYISTVGNPNRTMRFPITLCRNLPRKCRKIC